MSREASRLPHCPATPRDVGLRPSVSGAFDKVVEHSATSNMFVQDTNVVAPERCAFQLQALQ
jgi:hypothetical protein